MEAISLIVIHNFMCTVLIIALIRSPLRLWETLNIIRSPLRFLLRHHPCIRPIFFSSGILSNELWKTIIFQIIYFLKLRFKLLWKRRHQRQVFLITFCGIQFISWVKKSKKAGHTSDELNHASLMPCPALLLLGFL